MHRSLLACAAVLTLTSLASPGHAAPRLVATYTAGGTAVVKSSGQPPAVDDGTLVCNGGNDVGGACVSFGADPSTAVLVNDAVSATDVAFQVCIDNNGDGVCVSPDEGPCADLVFFSHDDSGRFFNPLGPLPTSFKAGCHGGPWQGYVVFLCTGVHNSFDGTATGSPHTHAATAGTVSVTKNGTGYGNFCGGVRQQPTAKRYVVLG